MGTGISDPWFREPRTGSVMPRAAGTIPGIIPWMIDVQK